MQRLALFIGAMVIAFAGGASYFGASLIVNYVERSTSTTVSDALGQAGLDWVSVRTDGLRLIVAGPAPDEASRFETLKIAKSIVNASRVVDAIKIVNPDDLLPPRFSLEMLRNGDGISLIGLIPETTGRAFVLQSINALQDRSKVTDMLETADYEEPETWQDALDFALSSLRLLPRSKISVTANLVEITAITDSRDEKARIEALLNDSKPGTINLVTHISAPRPVITPFSLRLVKDETGTRFDSCSADTAKTADRIVAAAKAAGLGADSICAIGLGAPSPRWGDAAVLAIGALADLGAGSLTFSDADITLVSADTTAQQDFDRIVHDLEQALPDVFSVHAILPPKPVVEGAVGSADVAEFLATKSPEMMVQMRGRLRDERTQKSVNNFAKAEFGAENVHDTTRTDPGLPDGWPLRVLAGLEGLAHLHHGSLVVHPELLTLRGVSDTPEASRDITQIFTEKLGDPSRFQINVNYEKTLDRTEVLPTPQECVDRINAILKEKQITYAPSSSTIDADGVAVVERIAEAMANCGEVPMEIGGYTDSQGREQMNQTLSQARAESVLDSLLSLDVLTTYLSAKGYGEANPIADNATEEGRQANRRIEFKLIDPNASSDAETVTDGQETQQADPKSVKKKEAENGQN